MNTRIGNLSSNERILSTLFGTGLTLLALRGRSPVLRILTAVAGASLLSRGAAGHCAMKAAMRGESSLREGFNDQWQALKRDASTAGRRFSRWRSHENRTNEPRRFDDEYITPSPPARESAYGQGDEWRGPTPGL